MICAIHQPNFFPWLGYFNKIYQSDVFVFLDCVNYPKSSKTMSTWTNRVSVFVNGKKHWINCPVIRKEGKQKICDVLIDNHIDWRKKLIKTLEYSYKKSNFYADVSEFVFSLIMYKASALSEYNCYHIKEICNKLKIDCQIYSQSELHTNGASTELLIEITKAVNCDTYMCGGGAGGYQENELFEQKQICLKYQNFKSPYYEQKDGQYIPGLSIIDSLFHYGFEGTRKFVMQKGQKSEPVKNK